MDLQDAEFKGVTPFSGAALAALLAGNKVDHQALCSGSWRPTIRLNPVNLTGHRTKF
jgi:hypothetical protein